MKKLMTIMAGLALIVLPLCAENVEMKHSGPSGQGDTIWHARSTGTTNMVMGVDGISYLTLDGSPITATVTKQTVTPVYAATNDPVVVVTVGTTTLTLPTTNDPTVVVAVETVTPVYAATNDPVVVVAAETGAVTAEGANDLVTPTATVTLFTTIAYDSTGAALTNATGESILVVTNATCAITPDLASNAVVAVVVTGGDAVMTNATATATLTTGESVDIMTNATATATLDVESIAGLVTSASATATLTTGQSVAIVTNTMVAITAP